MNTTEARRTWSDLVKTSEVFENFGSLRPLTWLVVPNLGMPDPRGSVACYRCRFGAAITATPCSVRARAVA